LARALVSPCFGRELEVRVATQMVNPNYFSKCPLMYNQIPHSNKNAILVAIIE